MLRVAENELGDADPARLADRLAQQRVRALAGFRRHQVVRRLEEPVVDLLGLHEVEDVDRPRFLDRGRLKIVFGDDEEAALLVLEALDEILPRHRMAVADAHALEAHRRFVFRMQHAEVRPMIANRRVQLDRDVDEAEGERALPESASHLTFFP